MPPLSIIHEYSGSCESRIVDGECQGQPAGAIQFETARSVQPRSSRAGTAARSIPHSILLRQD
jgi:hypothetical protein